MVDPYSGIHTPDTSSIASSDAHMSFSTALLNGNGNGMRAAVKSFEKISEIFGNLASLANFSNRARDGTNPFR